MYLLFNTLVHINTKSQTFSNHICRRWRRQTHSFKLLLYKLRKTPAYQIRIIDHAQNYPDCHFLTQGFNHGFKLQYLEPRLPRSSKHSPSLGKRFSVAEQTIDREILLGRVAGPFMQLPIPTLQGFFFRFCVPKRWQLSSYLPFLLSKSCFHI